MKTSIPPEAMTPTLERLAAANEAFAEHFLGEPTSRQAVHTVYGGAHLFRANSAKKLGDLALRFLDAYTPDAATLARAVRLEGDVEAVFDRVVHKLQTEAVEDFRIDFEDGYGPRPDDEEDACAVSAAEETARGLQDSILPPFIGIRIKPLSAGLHRRGLRTLDLYLTTLAEATGGALPANFVVTIPKVVIPEQVTALVDAFEQLEANTALASGALKLELMVETPQSIIDREGRSQLPLLVAAARGRCIAAHFGVYDYTASLSVTAAHQTMRHAVCDNARQVMQVALGGTGVLLSDGATNVVPVPVHREAPGEALTAAQVAENEAQIFGAMRLHFDDVRHSLANAFYQGWDLHPAHLVTRYAAIYSFFLEGLEQATERLRSFVDNAALATLAGDVFDDAATGQGLLNFFLRGVNCGAITEEEAMWTGLSLADLQTRSFAAILDGRSAG